MNVENNIIKKIETKYLNAKENIENKIKNV